MIRDVQTSIFKDLPPYSVILHQVNCQGSVQPGISSQMCREFPTWYQDFHGYCKWFMDGHASEILGTFHRHEVQDKKVIICSVFTQERAGKDHTAIDLGAWAKIVRKVFFQTKKVKEVTGQNWKIHIPANIGAYGKNGVNEELMEIFENVFGEDPDVQLWIHHKPTIQENAY